MMSDRSMSRIFSLDMPDIREAVWKMIRVCSGSVCLYWFAGEPTGWTIQMPRVFHRES